MKDSRDLAAGWLRKAANDLRAAQLLLKSGGPYDAACFHAQQTAEKALKGFLLFHERPFPFTHDLEELAALCDAAKPGALWGSPKVAELTNHAVKSRYDVAFEPNLSTARDAVRTAQRVFREVMAVLPMRPDIHRPRTGERAARKARKPKQAKKPAKKTAKRKKKR